MQCPRCQHENPADAVFCQECGGRLEAACPSCGTPNQLAAKFCKSCGQRLGQRESAPAAPEPRFGAPESYTPKHLAEKILVSRAALEGERKQVTVLFADLKGSMELLADRDPEEARKLLDPVLERMMEAVHRYEGTVNQVMGDGIMALFGAPVAHEDHAVRACYAALRMQDAVRRYSDELRRAQGVEAQIRVGLNSGEVVVRSIGSDLRMDYTAVGQTTHLAARMEQLAASGTVRLTGETLRLAEGYVEVRSLGPIPVKGLSDPIEIFELTGAGQARTRLQAAALRGLTRFVGRDAEVEHLRRVLGQAGTGHGQVVAIVGEAGVGKSRLVYEFTHSHRVQGWLILEASSVSYGKATSYLPVIDLLKGYFKIGDRDTHREMRDKVMGRVLGLDRALEPLLPPLLGLLDVPVEDAAWQSLDALQRRQKTLDAVKRLLLRESQVQPLLVVFEDLHWVDRETQALLDSLVDSLGSARVLLLVNYRPEYQHGWGSRTAYSQMRLDALAAESAGELLEALLGDDPGLAPLKQLLVKRGNPFFLEETVRMLVETKALEGSRGRYRLTQPLQALQVPSTVQTILAARIDRLAPEDKHLLQTASVVGKDVPFALLQTIVELSDEALRGGLDRLRAAEFLYETGLFPDLEYSFKHALTHEVTYGSLLQTRRRELHARIVQAMEGLYPDRRAEHVERLAHHATRAERWDKASDYLRLAGTRAAERSAHRAAVDWLEQALAALGCLPETQDTLARGLDVRFDLHSSLFALAEHVRMRHHMEAAEQIAVTIGDRHRLGRALASLCPSLRMTGELQRSSEVGRLALTIAAEVDDPRLEEEASFWLGQTHTNLGDHRTAEEFYRRNITPLPVDLTADTARPLPRFASNSRAWLASSLAQLGRFDEGLALGADALRIAQALDDKFRLIITYSHLGWLHLYRGTLADSIALLERALSLGKSWDISDYATGSTAGLAIAYALSGRIGDALERAGPSLSSFWPLWRGEVCYLAGRREEALEAVELALSRSRQRGERGHEGWARHLLGEIAVHRDPPDVEVGERHYSEALGRAIELGMRPLVAHCHLGLGKLYRRTGDQAKAHEHLTTATTMYREMGMTFWLGKAEAELPPRP